MWVFVIKCITFILCVSRMRGGGEIVIAANLYLARWVRALSSVCSMSVMTVMGPTPPGTGVMYEARRSAGSKSTSP